MTSYEEIYERFAQKVTDFNFLDLDEDVLSKLLYEYLLSAIVGAKYLGEDLELDDQNQCFTEDLLEVQKEVLALGMVIEWISPQLYSTNLTHQFFGGKEEKFYAQANHLDQLKSLFHSAEVKRDKLIRNFGYAHNDYIHPNEVFNIRRKTSTDDYNELENKPQINSVTLQGNKNSSELKLQGRMNVLSPSEIEKILYLDE